MRIYLFRKLYFLLILLFTSLLSASTPKILTYNSQKDFEKGQAKGVSINSLGEIRLAPATTEVFSAEIPFVWTSAVDGQGNLFLAGGNSGEVYRIDTRNQSNSHFSSPGQQIYALTVDAQDNLFVATSPDGKIYKVRAGAGIDAPGEVVFDTEDLYIWSMQVDRANNLYVATGEKGNIHKIDARGQHSVFYESEDAHIRKIILDGNGNVLAGTSDKGMIIRIDTAGKAFVLYDSPLVEVTDLAVDGAGNLYAAVSGESRVPRLPPAPASSSSGAGDSQAGSQEEDLVELPPQDVGSRSSGRSSKAELYRIAPDGTVSMFWSSRADRIFAITLGGQGDVILGTGDPGKLYSVSEPGEYTLLNEFEELQVTAIAASDQKHLFLCTSNTGKVYRSAVEFSASGDYLSEVIDAAVNSHWGEIHWEADLPSKTAVVLYSRSGNTEEPDQSWSEWSRRYSNPVGQGIASPPARFLQLKASLSTQNRKASPVLKEFTVSYLQKNIPPLVQEITLHPAGDFYPDAANNRANNSHLSNGQSSASNGSSSQSPGRKTFRKGYRTVSWKSRDDNGDQLSYDLFYMGVDEVSWKTLAEDFHGRVFSWDSELFPDGRYVIKVVAKDDLANPPSMSLSAEKTSHPFKVDNSGPHVGDISVQLSGKEAAISFSVSDEMTNITSVEYGINAEDWRLVYPVDGICDSKNERFELTSGSYVEGENIVVIKAKDALGNFGFGKAKIKL